MNFEVYLNRHLLKKAQHQAICAKPAAVLVPILEKKQPVVLLTKRSLHLKDHAGQIAFPGGCVENAESFVDAALREAFEEVGLQKQNAHILGFLPTLTTGTGFSIVPVVAKIVPPFDFHMEHREVSEIFNLPLDFLLNEKNHQQKRFLIQKEWRSFWTLAFQNYFIWGATAHILHDLFLCFKNPRST